jgi:hypothetical protein
MRKLIIAVSFSAFATGAFAQTASWGCGVDGFGGESRERVLALSTSNQMRTVVREYMQRWDAAHMRRQCENFANGRPFAIGCLNDRRDWDAIIASIPSEYSQMERRVLGDVIRGDLKSPEMVRDAVSYCEAVGATPKR